MLHPEIVPTILSQDEADYHEKLHLIEDLVTRVQIDIMDGQFVPATTIGASTLSAFATNLIRDIHLMVENPLAHFNEYSRLGVDHLIFHVEAGQGLTEVKIAVEEIKNLGNRVGLAFNLETPLSLLDDLGSAIDLVQLMAISPGFGGQNFEEAVLPKILAVRERFPALPIAVDGGVNLETIEKISGAGANIFVVNSSLFESPDIKQALQELRGKLGLGM